MQQSKSVAQNMQFLFYQIVSAHIDSVTDMFSELKLKLG